MLADDFVASLISKFMVKGFACLPNFLITSFETKKPLLRERRSGSLVLNIFSLKNILHPHFL